MDWSQSILMSTYMYLSAGTSFVLLKLTLVQTLTLGTAVQKLD